MSQSEVIPPSLPRRKRFPWLIYWIVLALIILVALAPVGSVVACGWIANAHGCKVDEARSIPALSMGRITATCFIPWAFSAG